MSNLRDSLKAFPLKYVVIIVILFFSGCAGTAAYKRFYTGTERPLSEIAILTEPNPYLRELIILKVDGKEMPFAGFMEFLPGHHKVNVLYYERSGGYKTTGRAEVEFNAQAGNVYEMFPVFHTHNAGWYLRIWDVTGELHTTEKQELVQKIDKILNKNRTAPASLSAIIENIPTGKTRKLPGFGEKIKAQFTGMKGKRVNVDFKFDRYKPYIIVKADDGLNYHVQLSQKDGSIIKVFGIKVWIKNVITGGENAFQPIGSDLAYTYFSDKNIGWMPSNGIFAVHKEISSEKYKTIKRAYSVSYGKQFFTALLDVSFIEGLNKEARKAMVYAVNADLKELNKNIGLVNTLRRNYTVGSKKYEMHLKELAFKFAKEAVRIAEKLPVVYPENTPEHKKVMSILAFSQQKLKECQQN
jgi:hypothetical protein